MDRKEISEHKMLRLKALYLMMFYIFESGKEKTPLHVMIATTIHSTGKSEALIVPVVRFNFEIKNEFGRLHNRKMFEYCSTSQPFY